MTDTPRTAAEAARKCLDEYKNNRPFIEVLVELIEQFAAAARAEVLEQAAAAAINSQAGDDRREQRSVTAQRCAKAIGALAESVPAKEPRT